jgi:putative FmdB family regulatory protein
VSKSILYDWRCQKCKHKFERMARSDVRQTDCPHCDGTANRLISTPRLDPRMGLDPDFPGAYDKWAKTRRQRATIEREHYKEHGDDLSPGADVK